MAEMELETMRPNPAWDPAAYEDAVETFEELRNRIRVHVWGGDWCKDCRSQLPDFGAALEATGIPDDRIHEYPVEKAEDGSKVGPRVDEYGIELIPTVVVELEPRSGSERASGERSDPRATDGEEVARYVESGDFPIFVTLAEQLETAV